LGDIFNEAGAFTQAKEIGLSSTAVHYEVAGGTSKTIIDTLRNILSDSKSKNGGSEESEDNEDGLHFLFLS